MGAEQWRPIAGYEGIYSVSDLGRVRRDAGSAGARAGRILRNRDQSDGYLDVNLSRDGHHRAFLVHVLVANAFLPLDPERIQVDHIDGNRKNPALSNLERVTPAENSRRRLERAGDYLGDRTHCKNGHPFEGDNLKKKSAKRYGRVCRACENARNRAYYARKTSA